VVETRIGDVIVFGLTDDELAKLKERTPVLCSGSKLGLPERIAIISGRDNKHVVSQLREMGLPVNTDKDWDKKGSVDDDGLSSKAACEKLANEIYYRSKGQPVPPEEGVTLESLGMLKCATCGHESPSQSNAILGARETVKPGDWFMCSRCGSASVMTEEMRGRQATEADIQALPERHQKLYRELSEALISRRFNTPSGQRGQA
jgi:hypothetical protein